MLLSAPSAAPGRLLDSCFLMIGTVVPLQPFAKAEPPACSDLEVDPVRPQRAPGGDPAIGGDHHAVDEAGSAEPVEADAQIRLLHDQQRGLAAADVQETGRAE